MRWWKSCGLRSVLPDLLEYCVAEKTGSLFEWKRNSGIAERDGTGLARHEKWAILLPIERNPQRFKAAAVVAAQTVPLGPEIQPHPLIVSCEKLSNRHL